MDVFEAPQATEQGEGLGIDLQTVDPDMTEIAEPREETKILRAPLPAGIDDGLQATFAAGHREVVVADLRTERLESILGRLVHPELVEFQRRGGDLGHRSGWSLRECLEEPLRLERQSHGPGRVLQGRLHRGVRRRLFPGLLPRPFPFPGPFPIPSPIPSRGGRVEVAANDVDGTAGDLEIPSTGCLGEGPEGGGAGRGERPAGRLAVGKLLGAELADPSLDRLGRRLLGGHRGTPERQQKREKPCRGDDAGGVGQSGERGRIHRKNLMIEQRDYTTVTPGSLREPEG